MRLKEQDIEYLANRVIERLQAEKRFKAKVPIDKIRARAHDVLLKNFKEEAAIEAEANKMMLKFEQQVQRGEIDAHKMFNMIKNQLAKDRNFVL